MKNDRLPKKRKSLAITREYELALLVFPLLRMSLGHIAQPDLPSDKYDSFVIR